MQKNNALKKPQSGDRVLKLIARYRQDTLEINRLLSQAEFTPEELRHLKALLLQDAQDRQADDMSSREWEEILEQRVVISPSRKEISLLAQMLCMI